MQVVIRVFAFMATVAPFIVLAQTTSEGTSGPKRMPERLAFAAAALPKPQVEPGELPRPCVSSNAPKTTSPEILGFLNKEGWPVVGYWAASNLQYVSLLNAKRCMDWDYVAKKLQAALGNPVTGVFGEDERDAIIKAISDSSTAFSSAYGAWSTGRSPAAGVQSAPAEYFLPIPVVEAGDVPHACRPGIVRVAPSATFPRHYQDVLIKWGALHFKIPAGCTDWGFIAVKWQEVIKSEKTGVFSANDIATIQSEISGDRGSIAAKKKLNEIAQEEQKAREAAQAKRDAEFAEAQKRADQLRHSATQFGSSPVPGFMTEQGQQLEANRQRSAQDAAQRQQEEAEFFRRRNEEIRRQNERWAEEERQRQMRPN